MKQSWIIGIIFLFLGLQVISGIGEYTVFGDEETTFLSTLMTTPNLTESTGIAGDVFAWIGWGGDFIATLWSALWFDYSFFQGQWALVRYIIFIPVSIGFILGIGLAMRGTSSS